MYALQWYRDDALDETLSAVADPGGRRPVRILLAEDDFEMRRFLAAALRKDGYEVVEAGNGLRLVDQLESFLTFGRKFDVDLVISDIRMPGVTGMEVLSRLAHFDGAPPMILITAFGDRPTHCEALRRGAAALLDKPFDIDDLRAVVRRVLPPTDRTPLDRSA